MLLTTLYRNRELLRSAQGKECANPSCSQSGTTVSAHLNSVMHGKGMGIKAPDYYTAHLCQQCHDLVDGRTGNLSMEERQDIWMAAYLVTVARWFNDGVVHVR